MFLRRECNDDRQNRSIMRSSCGVEQWWVKSLTVTRGLLTCSWTILIVACRQENVNWHKIVIRHSEGSERRTFSSLNGRRDHTRDVNELVVPSSLSVEILTPPSCGHRVTDMSAAYSTDEVGSTGRSKWYNKQPTQFRDMLSDRLTLFSEVAMTFGSDLWWMTKIFSRYFTNKYNGSIASHISI